MWVRSINIHCLRWWPLTSPDCRIPTSIKSWTALVNYYENIKRVAKDTLKWMEMARQPFVIEDSWCDDNDDDDDDTENRHRWAVFAPVQIRRRPPRNPRRGRAHGDERATRYRKTYIGAKGTQRSERAPSRSMKLKRPTEEMFLVDSTGVLGESLGLASVLRTWYNTVKWNINGKETMRSPLRELTYHTGSHSVITFHQAEVTFPFLPQPKLYSI